ncbi:hypothetical protein MLD38_031509 [Melastoma candidum]|uniref:Uncharacterized protein n=1 Tax=Melastoma candidum TaxID=119954 RepID=A0ACB9MRZ0_9MYRT|nr:hypothetical protein MLD38_031509 [Melastoma candidum]
MGGLCSKQVPKSNPYADTNGSFNAHKASMISQSTRRSNVSSSNVLDATVNHSQETRPSQEPKAAARRGSPPQRENHNDDFYDGIPRYPLQKSRSLRTQAAVAKMSEVSSRLSRGAVEVFDTLSSSVSSLNAGSGFASTVATKGNELGILAFEVANTVVKGSNLMQSLSRRSIRHLKEVVLPSEGVRNLISRDEDELLKIVETDKREELKIFSGEVVRFGNHCKDPQWHNLDRYFDKISRELTPQNQLKEEAESVMLQLMTLVQYTAELYHELHALDRFEQDYHRKRQEENNSNSTQKGDSLNILRGELKSQRRQVKNLKKKSLWSRSLEEVMEKLVDIMQFLLLEIHCIFGSADSYVPSNTPKGHSKLGPAGLSLHYANIILQVDTLVARSSSMPPSMRDSLYQSLPPNMKAALRSKIQSFPVKDELSVADIKAEMEKTLQWLVPIATNTAKAHHGFGWVGEWANTGSEVNKKPAGPLDFIRIETLHHANKDKTETYILEQLVWLHFLVAKSSTNGMGMRSPIKSPNRAYHQKSNNEARRVLSSVTPTGLTSEDLEMLQDIFKRKRSRGISKSQDFDITKVRLKKHDRLSKSGSHALAREIKEVHSMKRLLSGVPVIDFDINKEKTLDVIDRVEVHR